MSAYTIIEHNNMLTTLSDDHFQVVSKVIQAYSEGEMSINGRQCLDVLKDTLPTTTIDRSCYDLASPALQQWQVKVSLEIIYF